MAQEQHPDVLQRNAPVDKYERLYRKRRDRQHQHRHQRGRQFSKHHVTRLHRGRQHQFQRLAFPLAADTAGNQRRHDEKQHDKFDRGDERVEIQKLRILDLRRRPDLLRHRIHIKQRHRRQNTVKNKQNRHHADAAAPDCHFPPKYRIPSHVSAPPSLLHVL